jgi:predicted dienelactone hydrolase
MRPERSLGMRRHSFIAAVLLFAASVVSAEPYKGDAGPSKVTTRDEDWRDAARDRVVPVRIYLPADLAKPAPVILVSHGLGGTRTAMAYAANHWCSHGYVVIALQHPGSDDGVWRNAGTPREKLEAMRDAANGANLILRCDDVRFALDHLESLSKDAGSLAGKVDLTKIGIAGHSFGAQTVQGVIGQRLGGPRLQMPPKADARIKAAVAFSPGLSRGDPAWAFADVKVPCFHFTGTNDNVSLIRDMTLEQRRMSFDNIHAPGQRLITFEGGDHMVFSGNTLPNTDTTKYAHFHDLISQSTTAFWDAELLGDAKAKARLADDLPGEVRDDGKVEAHD